MRDSKGRFIKGHIPWIKGRKCTMESRKKMSLAKIGRKASQETIDRLRLVNLGNKYALGKGHSEKWRREMSLRMRGKNNPMYGVHPSEEIRRKLSKSHKGFVMPIKTKRKISDALKGDKSPFWLGGISFEPYTIDFNDMFKDRIKRRDDYTCKLCGLFDVDNLELYKCGLSIHYIDYDKKNTFPQNCISLCSRCNGLVNRDRDIWKKHFQEILKESYNYKYTQDQKIILDFMEEK